MIESDTRSIYSTHSTASPTSSAFTFTPLVRSHGCFHELGSIVHASKYTQALFLMQVDFYTIFTRSGKLVAAKLVTRCPGFALLPSFIRPTALAIPVLPWRASGNGCRYRAGGDAGSASPARSALRARFGCSRGVGGVFHPVASGRQRAQGPVSVPPSAH